MKRKFKAISVLCGDGTICQVHGLDTGSRVDLPIGVNRTAYTSMLEKELSLLLRLNIHIRVTLTDNFGNSIGLFSNLSFPSLCGNIDF